MITKPFIKRYLWLVILVVAVLGVVTLYTYSKNAGPEKGFIKPHPALYWESIGKGIVQCHLCPRHCVLAPGQWGFCRARKNIDGKLYSMSYGNPCAVHIDPIEKKPFSHFLPGTRAFSIATAGCNMRCVFCQNWEISQTSPETTLNYQLMPEDVVKLAKAYRCDSIAYTYSEPTNFYEYMLDTAKLAHKAGLKNVYHSNGFINAKPLRKLCKYLNAADIDLKGFSDEFYEKMSQASLAPVLRTLKILKDKNVHLEITNLIVPGENDSSGMIRKMCEWIKENLGPDVPLHFARFWPQYRLQNLQPTPIETLERARQIALDCGLHYPMIGNIPGHPGEDTYCPECGRKVIDRKGYIVVKSNLVDGKCKFCGFPIAGIWK